VNEEANLLPVSIRRARARRSASAVWGGAAAVAVLIAGTWALRARATMGDGGAELTRLLGEREKNVESLKLQVGRLSAELGAVLRELTIADRIQSRPEWSNLLGILGGLVGPDAVIETCKLTDAPQPRAARSPGKPAGAAASAKPEAAARIEPGYILMITGAAKDQRTVSELVTEMEATGVFSRITQQSRRRSLLQGEAVGFEIKAEIPPFVEDGP
jgi:hypothetical protein